MLQRFVIGLSLAALVAACSGAPEESLVVATAHSESTPPVDPVPDAGDPRTEGRGGGLLDWASGEEAGAPTEERFDYSSLPAEMVAQLIQSPTPRYRSRVVPGFPGLMEFAIFNTGSGYEERFLLQMPRAMPTSPVPLVVVFHKYGASHGDLLNSGFIPEVRARGWFAVCPLGAQQKNFGSLESQINTQAVLRLVRQLFPIDPLRVYGVGFSMGGGSATNYAARHLDPKATMFAAVCDHTGGVSLGHTWWSEFDDADLDDNVPNPGDHLEVPDVLESLFGGTPTARPFDYQRCSSIDLDPFTGLVGANSDFARNLAHVPTLVWRATNDPTAFLVIETDTFEAHIAPQNPQNAYQLAPGAVHAWTTLDANWVCNWFATKSLGLPSSGRLLADEDGEWLYFHVVQDSFGAFTPFTWNVNAAQKRIEISASVNLRRLRITPAGFGLALTGAVTLRLSSADATGDEFQFLYAPNAPLSVTRDGVSASGTYDAAARTFLVVETDAALHEWVITFP